MHVACHSPWPSVLIVPGDHKSVNKLLQCQVIGHIAEGCPRPLVAEGNTRYFLKERGSVRGEITFYRVSIVRWVDSTNDLKFAGGEERRVHSHRAHGQRLEGRSAVPWGSERPVSPLGVPTPTARRGLEWMEGSNVWEALNGSWGKIVESSRLSTTPSSLSLSLTVRW